MGNCCIRVDSDPKTWHLTLKYTRKSHSQARWNKLAQRFDQEGQQQGGEMDLLLRAGKDVEMKHPKAAREGEGPSCWAQYWDFPSESS